MQMREPLKSGQLSRDTHRLIKVRKELDDINTAVQSAPELLDVEKTKTRLSITTQGLEDIHLSYQHTVASLKRYQVRIGEQLCKSRN